MNFYDKPLYFSFCQEYILKLLITFSLSIRVTIENLKGGKQTAKSHITFVETVNVYNFLSFSSSKLPFQKIMDK